MAATTKKATAKPKAEKAKSNGKAGAKAAKVAQKEQERKAAIKAGELIEADGAEFRLVTERAKATVDERTAKVIERLRSSSEPVPAKQIHEEMGGAYALLIPVYSTLLALGLVKRYQRSTGEKGGGGIAYLWIGE